MLTSATEAEFTDFLSTYGYAVASESGPLLALSFIYLKTLPWCDPEQSDDENIKQAQLFIAYAMSAEGGGFNPSAQTNGLVIKSQSVGSLEQEFMFNESVDLGSSSLSQLKNLPIPYGLLYPFMCSRTDITETNHQASVYVV